MRVLVTGSSGHLGEGLMRVLRDASDTEPVGLDVLQSPYTSAVGSVTDRAFVRRSIEGADAVIHAATLHKPHVSSNPRQDFIDTNVTGTLVLLEEAVAAGVQAFVFTSSTTTFGHALSPPVGEPAAWVTEDVAPVAKNIYGVTKAAAEDLCELFHRHHGLPCVVLRTSRFFPEPDDREDVRGAYDDLNLKVNELLYRRVDLEDAVEAHRLALTRAAEIGFARLIVSATTPFTVEDLALLGRNAPAALARRVPEYRSLYERLGWRMFDRLDRVYVNARARALLGWRPRYDFRHALQRLEAGEDPRSELTLEVGAKGYHPDSFGVYTTRRR
jgi:nucleoside-diphosphate-sugar epimerase